MILPAPGDVTQRPWQNLVRHGQSLNVRVLTKRNPCTEQLKSTITYEAENTERGAQLRITTRDAEALTAIHSFLRFQIQDHQTGDSLEIQK
jgi:hypothetical protein